MTGRHELARALRTNRVGVAARWSVVEHALLDLFMPQRCVVTGVWLPSDHAPLHPDLVDGFEDLLNSDACPRCGRAARPETIFSRTGERAAPRCGGCDAERFWNCRAIVVAGAYQGVIRDLLTALKFGGWAQAANLIASALSLKLAAAPWVDEIDLVTAVPMHRLRRWQRPCDHAHELGMALARRLNRPFREVLRRARYGPSQMLAASRAARFRQVRDSFRVTQSKRVAGKTVLLVDNLITTGATLTECARVLRLAGAKRIYGAAGGRVVRIGDAQPVAT